MVTDASSRCAPASVERHVERTGVTPGLIVAVWLATTLIAHRAARQARCPAAGCRRRQSRSRARPRRVGSGSAMRSIQVSPQVARRHGLDEHTNAGGRELRFGLGRVARRRVAVGEQHDARHVPGQQFGTRLPQRLIEIGRRPRFTGLARIGGIVGRQRRAAPWCLATPPRWHPNAKTREWSGLSSAVRASMRSAAAVIDCARNAVRHIDEVDDRQTRRTRGNDRPCHRENQRDQDERARGRLHEPLLRVKVRPAVADDHPHGGHEDQEPKRGRRRPAYRHLTPSPAAATSTIRR